MLRICADNARNANLSNIELVPGDDALSGATSQVDLLTSCIVFQHIPPERGYTILNNLVSLLKPGGHAYLQLTYANEIRHLPGEVENQTGFVYRYYHRSGDGLRKLIKKPDDSLLVQMHHYDLNEVFCILADNHVSEYFCRHTNHEGTLGLELFLRRATS
jgi:hypothetical protein